MSRSLLLLTLLLCATNAFAQDAALPAGDPREDFVHARVAEVLSEEQRYDDSGAVLGTVQTLRVVGENGAWKNEEFSVVHEALLDRRDPQFQTGDAVVLERLWNADGTVDFLVREPYRLHPLLALLCGFFLLAILIGRKTGAASIAGLGVSILILVFFVVPRIVAGDDPLLTCLIGAVAIACSSLYIAHGMRQRTTIALVSTLITLFASAILAIIAVRLTGLQGTGSEEALFLQFGPTALLDLRGLLLGGMLIGTLGVLDDITTAQAATVEEISRANRAMRMPDLLRAGASVGREHIAALINTLALAYFGSSLPLFLLFSVHNDTPWWVILNSAFIAEEVVRTLVGSTALLLAVPITTSIAAFWFREGQHLSSSSAGHGHTH